MHAVVAVIGVYLVGAVFDDAVGGVVVVVSFLGRGVRRRKVGWVLVGLPRLRWSYILEVDSVYLLFVGVCVCVFSLEVEGCAVECGRVRSVVIDGGVGRARFLYKAGSGEKSATKVNMYFYDV